MALHDAGQLEVLGLRRGDGVHGFSFGILLEDAVGTVIGLGQRGAGIAHGQRGLAGGVLVGLDGRGDLFHLQGRGVQGQAEVQVQAGKILYGDVRAVVKLDVHALIGVGAGFWGGLGGHAHGVSVDDDLLRHGQRRAQQRYAQHERAQRPPGLANVHVCIPPLG